MQPNLVGTKSTKTTRKKQKIYKTAALTKEATGTRERVRAKQICEGRRWGVEEVSSAADRRRRQGNGGEDEIADFKRREELI